MSDCASTYPICVLLQHLIEQHGPSKSEFVQRLGYSPNHAYRGLRRLEPWLEQGEGFDRIIEQIASVYPLISQELTAAIAETNAMKKAEAEAVFRTQCEAEEPTFVPYIHAQGEKTVPDGITIFGMTGGHRRWTTVWIRKDILDMPLEEQLARMPELMAAYVKEYGGACPFFGKLTGFRFVRLLDYFQFDQGGHFVGRVAKPYRAGFASVSLR
jgi:hypothetical protein